MRIVLINIGRKTEIRIPQGLLYLASALHANGHEPIVHDEALAATPEESFDQILSYDTDIIGLSVYTLPWQLKRVEELSKTIKAVRKNALIIWGGWHASLYPKHSIVNRDVDIVVRGPGEDPICELLDVLEKGHPLRDIPGLVFKDKGHIVQTGLEPPDIEHLFPPLNFKLINLHAYLKMHDRGTGILQYITTRGCNGRCRFCLVGRLFKGYLARKPAEQIRTELKYLLKHHTVTSIHFSDDNTFRNNHEALQLCRGINDLTNNTGIPWRCATRIDTLSNLSADTYQKLAAAGCEGVVVGIESGVDRVLQLMGKGINVSQTEKALGRLVNNGLHKNLFSFLFNFPGETKDEATKTLRLACKTRLMSPKSIIMLHVFFPGASDSSSVPLDTSKTYSPPLSEIFDQYYTDHIRNYSVGRIRMNVLRYYFNASEQNESKGRRRFEFLRRLRYRLIQLRVKHCFFAIPFEYYLLKVIKRIKKPLT